MTDAGNEERSGLGSLLALLAGLKRIPRTGWLDRGLPRAEAESVADHALLTALIAWFAAAEAPDLDRDRVLKLALVHDLTEAIIGDPPPYDRAAVPSDVDGRRAFFSVRHVRSPEERAAKRAAERRASRHMLDLMPASIRAEIAALWAEYDARETPEARFVAEVDRLEAYLQARTYATDHPGLPLMGFTDMAQKEIAHPLLAALRDAAGEPDAGET